MNTEQPIRTYDDLLSIFQSSEKPRELWRIGAESEKFGIARETGRPLGYARADTGDASVEALFEGLVARFGYEPSAEYEGGPVLSLTRGNGNVTLEPGAQVEWSGAPFADVHGISDEMNAHFSELLAVSDQLGIEWLSVGFHPLARLDELPRVPKQRYPIMHDYLPQSGPRALDMMWRTATVQANYDFESEADAMKKLKVALRLSPIAQTLGANAPFFEGHLSDRKSERADVWLHMPPDRSGLVPQIWAAENPGYRDYVEWALDAGMFLFKREERVYKNTGQPFRDFWQRGYEGERATLADWALHLNTLFPEVRLKNTLEIRCSDALPAEEMNAVPALFTGLLYDEQALAESEELTRGFDLPTIERARAEMPVHGFKTLLYGRELGDWAVRVVQIAGGGLERRARRDNAGRDESFYLAPLARLVEAGIVPADRLRSGLSRDDVTTKEIRRRCSLTRSQM